MSRNLIKNITISINKVAIGNNSRGLDRFISF
jgi:hypothetical protein